VTLFIVFPTEFGEHDKAFHQNTPEWEPRVQFVYEIDRSSVAQTQSPQRLTPDKDRINFSITDPWQDFMGSQSSRYEAMRFGREKREKQARWQGK